MTTSKSATDTNMTQWDRKRAQVKKDFGSGLMLYLEFCEAIAAIDIEERDATRGTAE